MDSKMLRNQFSSKGSVKLLASISDSPVRSYSMNAWNKDCRFGTAKQEHQSKQNGNEHGTSKTEHCETYGPKPYIFCLPNTDHPSNFGYAHPPPLHIQLDHTLAVIWQLFSSETTKKSLSIAQLQWALTFLKTINYSNCPKDVTICIRRIEDELIAAYAKMVDSVKPKTSKEERVAIIPKLEDKNTNSNKESPSNNHATKALSSISTGRASGDPFIKTVPFSLNYSEIKSKMLFHLEDLLRAKKDCTTTSQLSNLIQMFGADVNMIPSESPLSKEGMMQLLTSWRREQIKKIRQELKQLHSIENYMGQVDGTNFEPFLDKKQANMLFKGEEHIMASLVNKA